jgi:hypothetical protein
MKAAPHLLLMIMAAHAYAHDVASDLRISVNVTMLVSRVRV